MRLKIIAAVLLLVIGVGAVGFVVIGPSLGGGSSSTLLTAQATMTNVVDDGGGDRQPGPRHGLRPVVRPGPDARHGIEQLEQLQLQWVQRIGQRRLAGQDGQRRRRPDGQEG